MMVVEGRKCGKCRHFKSQASGNPVYGGCDHYIGPLYSEKMPESRTDCMWFEPGRSILNRMKER